MFNKPKCNGCGEKFQILIGGLCSVCKTKVKKGNKVALQKEDHPYGVAPYNFMHCGCDICTGKTKGTIISTAKLPTLNNLNHVVSCKFCGAPTGKTGGVCQYCEQQKMMEYLHMLKSLEGPMEKLKAKGLLPIAEVITKESVKTAEGVSMNYKVELPNIFTLKLSDVEAAMKSVPLKPKKEYPVPDKVYGTVAKEAMWLNQHILGDYHNVDEQAVSIHNKGGAPIFVDSIVHLDGKPVNSGDTMYIGLYSDKAQMAPAPSVATQVEQKLKSDYLQKIYAEFAKAYQKQIAKSVEDKNKAVGHTAWVQAASADYLMSKIVENTDTVKASPAPLTPDQITQTEAMKNLVDMVEKGWELPLAEDPYFNQITTADLSYIPLTLIDTSAIEHESVELTLSGLTSEEANQLQKQYGKSKTVMVAKKVRKEVGTNSKAIISWPFESSSMISNGVIPVYKTQLNEDGTVSCNCRGWTTGSAKNQDGRFCKHTKAIESEFDIKTLYKKWKKGEPLGEDFELENSVSPTTPGVSKTVGVALVCKRLIEL
jgi:hypothetical protein